MHYSQCVWCVFVLFTAGQTFTANHKTYDKSRVTQLLSTQGYGSRGNGDQGSEVSSGSREHRWWDSLLLPRMLPPACVCVCVCGGGGGCNFFIDYSVYI